MKSFFVLTCLVLSGVLAAWAQTPKKSGPAPTAKTAPVTLNFVNAEIEAIARTIATLTNRNVVVDPRVKGQMNLSTEKPVGGAEAFNQFLSALRLQGFTVVESGGLYKAR
jgi:general secretion pathway protein D